MVGLRRLHLLLGIASALFVFVYLLTVETFILKTSFGFASYSSNVATSEGASYHETNKEIKSQPGGAGLHLIIQFPVLYTFGSPENSTLVRRQEEYIYCLRRNLLSPHVQEIHIICENRRDPLFIKGLSMSMTWKLVFYYLGRRMHYKDAFGYASQNLLNKNVMIIQADCYIDKGFEKLNDNLLSNRTMYALTRHKPPENNGRCEMVGVCEEAYIGSHDAYLFRLQVPLSLQLLQKIDYPTNPLGIEQVLMFNLRTYERFIIKNPCKILHIVHQHCSTLRGNQLYDGKRLHVLLNITTKKMAPYSDL